MRRPLLVILLSFLFVSTCLLTPCALDISGVFRDDLYLVAAGNGFSYGNSMENRLILRKSANSWKFYGDLRLYIYSGLFREISPDPEFQPMRFFIRFSSSFGTFTLGRTYIAVGNIGPFNPFDTSKELNISDVSYDKTGMDGVIWDLSLGDLTGLRMWLAPDTIVEKGAAGISLHTNIGTFDIGAVLSRFSAEQNLAGLYFKGDLYFSVQAALAQHFDDSVTRDFLEANLGLERFFGTVFLQLVYYYNEKGADEISEYGEVFSDAYNKAKHYLYANLSFSYDEFLSFYIYSFTNGIDLSSVIAPGIRWTINNGLNATMNLFFLTGGNKDEYSSAAMGRYGIMLRFEAKL
ncbi:hypothetical protein KAI78_04150 [bacterium]|nr:hypothetical protein [bacterium]